MEAIRTIVNSSLLDKISLPQNFKNRRVEIIIRTIDDNEHVEIVSDDELFNSSDLLIKQNREAYEVLAK